MIGAFLSRFTLENLRIGESLRMDQLLSGKIAVVTGASRGIGRSICDLFAKHGALVIACVRRIDDVQLHWQASLKSAGISLTLVTIDLADHSAIKKTVKEIRSLHPSIDILVNCAGMADGATFHMTSIEQMRSLFELNVFAPVMLSQSLSRLMSKANRGGSIINISSSATYLVDIGTMAYGASKQALERVSQSMAVELAGQKIRVNVICPGITKTDMAMQMQPSIRNKLIESSLLKKWACPVDIANAALFLASDLSSHITAQIMRVDGGGYS